MQNENSGEKVYQVSNNDNDVPEKGFVRLCSIRNIEKYESLDSFYTKLFIVRSLGKRSSFLDEWDFIHVPQLSPSSELFGKYNNQWKKGIFTRQEKEVMAKSMTNSWWDLYVPDFIQEMNGRRDIQVCLKKIMRYLDNGKSVMLTCFCNDFNRCHRGLLGYYLQSKGYEVRFS